MKINRSGVPTGHVIDFGGGECPAGYLLCDGSAVSMTAYAALFEAIGVRHGEGDGATTFHLPDRRGRFPRGADDMGSGAAGRDPDADARTASNSGGVTGNEPGTVQGEAYKLHKHGSGNNPNYSNKNGNISVGSGTTGFANGTGTSSSQIATSDSGANETRPQNQATIYAIKY
jgi:microcystin-dependent protein